MGEMIIRRTMRVLKITNCPEKWVLQAFIDGELDPDNQSKFRDHLQFCNRCNEGINDRKNKSQKVLQLLELTDHYHSTNKYAIVKSRSKKNIIHLAAWGSVAATALILISIFSLYINPSTNHSIAVEQNCEWVELDEIGFHPSVESPNRIYRMRLIEIKTVNDEGDYSRKILAKPCNFQEINN